MNNILKEAETYLGLLEDRSARLQASLRTEYAPLRVTLAEARVLSIIRSHATGKTPLSLTEISRELPIDTSPSRVVNDLCDRKLVKAERDRFDKRVWRFSLTGSGKKLVSEIEAVRKRFVQAIAARSSRTELSAGVQLLRSMPH